MVAYGDTSYGQHSEDTPDPPEYHPGDYAHDHDLGLGQRGPDEHAALPRPVDDAPPLPKGGYGGPGNAVDTDSLGVFAANVRSLRSMVTKVQSEVSGIEIRPGAGKAAGALLEAVDAKRLAYTDYLMNLFDAFDALGDKVTALAAKYETTEEANEMTAEHLNKVMQDVTTGFAGLTATE